MTVKLARIVVSMGALLGGLAGGAFAQVGGGTASGEKFVLSGVILFEGGGGLVWLQEPGLTGDRSVPVRLSESIGPYRLTRILEDRIELQGPAGMVLVPVRNAQPGAGPAVAQAAPGGVAGGSRPARADAAADAAAPAGEAPPQPAAAPLQGDSAAGMQALRDRLELARKQVEQLQRSPQAEAARLGALPSGPSRSAGQPAASGSGAQTGTANDQGGNTSAQGGNTNAQGGNTNAQGGNTNVPGGNTSTQGANPNVVVPAPRQTFQSILGLN